MTTAAIRHNLMIMTEDGSRIGPFYQVAHAKVIGAEALMPWTMH